MCSGGSRASSLAGAPRADRWRCWAPTTPLLLLAYLSYLLLGSAAFWALESPGEEEEAQALLRERWDLLENFTCLEKEALEQLAKLLTDQMTTVLGDYTLFRGYGTK
ncbi:hypothetical protein JD844_025069 [Phrynosoma platyrhinos]|uniref:Uncharacterized protein n=1 Tax=Phrynosoma platyrhinos TaxID=52577 RepID=A0ABQ7SZ91_PHRPL|nr:hypothetical protein JD844_025069 [Phrynosoma platyrhinos]